MVSTDPTARIAATRKANAVVVALIVGTTVLAASCKEPAQPSPATSVPVLSSPQPTEPGIPSQPPPAASVPVSSSPQPTEPGLAQWTEPTHPIGPAPQQATGPTTQLPTTQLPPLPEFTEPPTKRPPLPSAPRQTLAPKGPQ